MTKVTAKYEIVLPFEITMSEAANNLLVFYFKDVGEALIHPPKLITGLKPSKGRYDAHLFIDVILDILKKPQLNDFDNWFFSKCASAMTFFITAVWLNSQLTSVDPYATPLYVRCDYFDDKNKAFINPDTKRSWYEEALPLGIVLSKDNWISIGDSIISHKQFPVDNILILNAKMMLSQNRFDIAILFAAIVCEYKVKSVCTNIAEKKGINGELWDVIVQRLNPRVFQYFDDIMPCLGIKPPKNSSDAATRALPKKLEALFGDRNKIAHFGTVVGYKGAIKSGPDMKLLATKHVHTAEQLIAYLDGQEANIN